MSTFMPQSKGLYLANTSVKTTDFYTSTNTRSSITASRIQSDPSSIRAKYQPVFSKNTSKSPSHQLFSFIPAGPNQALRNAKIDVQTNPCFYFRLSLLSISQPISNNQQNKPPTFLSHTHLNAKKNTHPFFQTQSHNFPTHMLLLTQTHISKTISIRLHLSKTHLESQFILFLFF